MRRHDGKVACRHPMPSTTAQRLVYAFLLLYIWARPCDGYVPLHHTRVGPISSTSRYVTRKTRLHEGAFTDTDILSDMCAQAYHGAAFDDRADGPEG